MSSIGSIFWHCVVYAGGINTVAWTTQSALSSVGPILCFSITYAGCMNFMVSMNGLFFHLPDAWTQALPTPRSSLIWFYIHIPAVCVATWYHSRGRRSQETTDDAKGPPFDIRPRYLKPPAEWLLGIIMAYACCINVMVWMDGTFYHLPELCSQALPPPLLSLFLFHIPIPAFCFVAACNRQIEMQP